MANKIIGLKIFQPFAQFRNPLTFYYAQSYPLPPKTTIIGFLQNLLGKYYDPSLWSLKISIHGGFESYFWNYQNLIKGNISLLKLNNKIFLINQERPLYFHDLKSQRSPVYQQELFNGYYYIFLKGDERILEEILKRLDNPPFVLRIGRSEDIIFIKDVYVEGINLEYEQDFDKSDEISFKLPTYIKLESSEDDDRVLKLELDKEKYPIYFMPMRIDYMLIEEENGGVSLKTIRVRTLAEVLYLKNRILRNPYFAKVLYLDRNNILLLKNEVSLDLIKFPEGELLTLTDFGWL